MRKNGGRTGILFIFVYVNATSIVVGLRAHLVAGAEVFCLNSRLAVLSEVGSKV